MKGFKEQGMINCINCCWQVKEDNDSEQTTGLSTVGTIGDHDRAE